MILIGDDVDNYSEKLGYELPNKLSEEIARWLNDSYQEDYDYDTFMSDGIEEFISLVNDESREDYAKYRNEFGKIEKIDHDCKDYAKSQGQGSYDRCGYCGSLIIEEEEE